MTISKTKMQNQNNFSLNTRGNRTKYSNIKSYLPESIYNTTIDPVIAYGDKSLIEKIAEAVRYNQNSKSISLKSYGIEQYIFDFSPAEKQKTIQIAFDRANTNGSTLMDYELRFVDDKSLNSFSIIKLKNNEKITNYSRISDTKNLAPRDKKKLYDDIKLLAQNGIKFPISAIFQNPQKDFKLLDFSCLSIDGFSSIAEREEYLKNYQVLLIH